MHTSEYKKKIYLWAALCLLLIVGVFMIFRQSFGLSSTDAELLLSGINPDTQVFVNNQKAVVKMSSNGGLIDTPAGTTTIIAANPNSWPWQKTLNLSPEKMTVVAPLLLPKSIGTVNIEVNNPEYSRIAALAQNGFVPSAPGRLNSNDGLVSIWVSNGTVFARWTANDKEPIPAFCDGKCSPEISAFHTDMPIKNIAFYGKRNDVILLAIGPNIIALELDRHPVQNSQPLFSGSNPRFYEAPDGTFYVLDSGVLSRLLI